MRSSPPRYGRRGGTAATQVRPDWPDCEPPTRPTSSRYPTARRARTPSQMTSMTLKPFVGAAIAKITALGDPVIIVNGDKDMAREEVDFDQRDVWRVLVGGTKLSRGFTIEGLTVSYYRRKTKQADTLMQMGRWFGFRRGYEDLVRLFIGRAEPDGLGTIDLYEAFDAIVRDEEAFRDELRKYATLVDGHPQITPMEIPPLVSQHLPWLKPAAPNKMFNAELVMKKSPGSLVTPTGYPTDESTKAQNYTAVLPILLAAVRREKLVVPAMQGVTRSTFDAWVGEIESHTLIEAISSIKWITDEYYKADIAFFREIQDDIDKWITIAPQTEHLHELPGCRRSRRIQAWNEEAIQQGLGRADRPEASSRRAPNRGRGRGLQRRGR